MRDLPYFKFQVNMDRPYCMTKFLTVVTCLFFLLDHASFCNVDIFGRQHPTETVDYWTSLKLILKWPSVWNEDYLTDDWTEDLTFPCWLPTQNKTDNPSDHCLSVLNTSFRHAYKLVNQLFVWSFYKKIIKFPSLCSFLQTDGKTCSYFHHFVGTNDETLLVHFFYSAPD